MTATRTPDPAHRHRPAHRLAGALVLAATITLGACGGTGPAPSARPAAPSTTAATPSNPTTAPPRPERRGAAPATAAAAPTLAVRADRPLAVHTRPGDATATRTLPATDELGSPLVLLVTEVGAGRAAGWLRVLLPGRPNGGTGWVRTADVTAHEVDHEVRVDLAARTLTVLDGDHVLLTTPVAIGDPDHPTPTGRFSLTDKLETGDEGSSYGPFALGLSGRSEVLTEFAGGDGQIGIHGTDDPSSIGRAASHGCIRVPNAVARTLAGLLSLGTPVTIA